LGWGVVCAVARGQHTEPILREHGYTADEITDLVRRGVVVALAGAPR
jgi:crotonobetainyl-CoA:carnitine CoA-transferase CaiB-like acyl-CoA transferase